MPQATGLVAELKAAFPDVEAEFELIRSSGGAFEVRVGDDLIFSKLATQRFPAYRELPKLLGG